MIKNNRLLSLIIAGSVVLGSLLACGLPGPAATTAPLENTPEVVNTDPVVVVSTETARPPIVHVVRPGELPAGWLSEVTDRDTSLVAGDHRASGGENFSVNLYERPFNAGTMERYFADLDITRARLYEDAQWVYVTIRLAGAGESGSPSGSYGVEVDLDVDGRGDLLVFASGPGGDWSTDGVRVWLDVNNDVGGEHPINSDAPLGGDGYETLTFEAGVGSDPDLAWARLAPGEPATVQVAFMLSLLNGDGGFTWGAWAERSVLTPGWFDYNDHFTAVEAGSSLVENGNYPIQALYEMDNTCRWVVGFTPSGYEPGICIVPATPTPNLPGTISGVVFDDGTNGDLVLGPGSFRIAGASVRARQGECGSPGGVVATATSNASGGYSMNVPAGTYCVDVSPDPVSYSYKTSPQTVTVGNGGSVNNVNFGYSQYLGMR